MRALNREPHSIGWDNARGECLPEAHHSAVPFDLDPAYPPVQAGRAACGTIGDRVALDPGGIRDEPSTPVAGGSREHCCMDQPSGPAVLPPPNGTGAVMALEPDLGQQPARLRADRRAARRA